jgi:hypothetical protein
MSNALTHLGQKEILEVALAGRAEIAAIYFGLTNSALSAASVLSDAEAQEPAVANGYARVAITQTIGAGGWVTSALNTNWQLTSDNIVWTASGGAIPDVGASPNTFARVFMCDGDVGVGTLLLGFWDVAATSIADGDTLTFVSRILLT